MGWGGVVGRAGEEDGADRRLPIDILYARVDTTHMDSNTTPKGAAGMTVEEIAVEVYKLRLEASSGKGAVARMIAKDGDQGQGLEGRSRSYLPIVRAALPWARVCGLEVCSQYDPSQILPQQVAFVESADAALETREAFHPVWILTARDLRYDRGMG